MEESLHEATEELIFVITDAAYLKEDKLNRKELEAVAALLINRLAACIWMEKEENVKGANNFTLGISKEFVKVCKNDALNSLYEPDPHTTEAVSQQYEYLRYKL